MDAAEGVSSATVSHGEALKQLLVDESEGIMHTRKVKIHDYQSNHQSSVWVLPNLVHTIGHPRAKTILVFAPRMHKQGV